VMPMSTARPVKLIKIEENKFLLNNPLKVLLVGSFFSAGFAVLRLHKMAQHESVTARVKMPVKIADILQLLALRIHGIATKEIMKPIPQPVAKTPIAPSRSRSGKDDESNFVDAGSMNPAPAPIISLENNASPKLDDKPNPREDNPIKNVDRAITLPPPNLSLRIPEGTCMTA